VAQSLGDAVAPGQSQLSMPDGQRHRLVDLGHACEQGYRPLGGEHIYLRAWRIPVQHDKKALRHDHVANPGGACYQDAFSLSHLLEVEA
jgi:hypothetical protein